MIALIVIWSLSARGDVNLRLNDVIGAALAGSPQLREQRELTRITHGDRWRRFLINEPAVSVTSADNGAQVQYGASLPIPFPGKSLALAALDRARDQEQKAELGARAHDVLARVVAAYLECATAAATQAVQSRAVDDLEEVFRLLKTLYESGHSTQAEKIGAELQSRQARAEFEVAKFRRDTACRKFSELWRIETGAPSPSPGELTLELPDDVDAAALSKLGSRTADEMRAEAQADVARARANQAAWSVAPDLTVSAVRNHYRYFPASPNGQTWTTGFTVSMTLPLFYPFAEGIEAKRTRASARLDQTAAEVRRVSARADVDEARREYRHARTRLSELRSKDLILGEALSESTASAYRQGRLGFAELMLSRRTLADLRTQDIALRATIIDAHVRCLDQCTGGPP